MVKLLYNITDLLIALFSPPLLEYHALIDILTFKMDSTTVS